MHEIPFFLELIVVRVDIHSFPPSRKVASWIYNSKKTTSPIVPRLTLNYNMQ